MTRTARTPTTDSHNILTGSSENDTDNITSESAHDQRPSGNSRRRSRRHTQSDDRNPEMILKMLLQGIQKLWQQIKHASNYVMIELGGYQLLDKIVQWCVRNPHIAICLLAGGVVMLLPLLIILGFGLMTVVMTFTGFLVLEGTLLTIVSMMLLGCFGALAIVLLFFAVVTVGVYLGFVHVYDIYGGMEQYKTAIINFLQKERLPPRTTTTPLRNHQNLSADNAGSQHVNVYTDENIGNITQ